MEIIYLIYAYVISGLVFSIPFLSSWVKTIDDGAHGSIWPFKLMVLPGCIVFWPVLLRKYLIMKLKKK